MQRIAWITVLLAALTATATAATRVYQWSDRQGQVHYGELPPVGHSAQTIDVQTPTGHPRPSPNQPAGRPDASVHSSGQEAASKPGESDQHAQTVAQDPQRLREQCQAARHNLQFLQAGGSNRRFRDSTGNVVRYTEEQRQAKIAAAEGYIEQHCPAQ
ncbi:MAG: DUF4124 domain-containing protein [Nitrococcus sp.]|nr:DUF4124 domain-containing protein [Nitrococcus sp.]